MSKSTHLILGKLVLNDFHLKVASWDKIQKSLFQEGVVGRGGLWIAPTNVRFKTILKV